MTPQPANLNRPGASRPQPADLQAAFALRLGGLTMRDQILLLTRAPHARETAAPTTPGRLRALSTPSLLTRPRACA